MNATLAILFSSISIAGYQANGASQSTAEFSDMATCFSAIERIQKLAKASAIRNNVETVKISDGVLLRYFSSSTSKVEHTLICVNK
ncbi:hypothetical protein KEN51_CDS0144 [Pseudomonas phage vB_Pae10145-KEN51]|nr:hypothetical protein [Pseudomonas aeruginosa]YP_009617416.1 hypothetical protein FDI90_gp128 [Pseudomonas phage PA7]YP_009619639.1 hypothetical protein FDJ06_gp099 [Pseudomonas phage SL2]ANM45038.1 hypothetical protein KTN4_280 [Pseudomonas phage KTN4]QJB22914.1 hypothetical protein fnug_271 [Pseudomonas phage fnug]QOV08126.1 hypothetical protein [Pseudomonas phage vB_PaeM_kmuB]UXD83253.1 hypothetical protein NP274_00201 [Pseudomonas phage Koomba boorn-mokiny kep-wari Wadjak 1]UXD83421.1 